MNAGRRRFVTSLLERPANFVRLKPASLSLDGRARPISQ